MPDTIEAPTILVEKKGRITLWQVGEFSRDDYILSELQTFAQEETARFNLSRGVDGAVTLESVEMQEDSSLAVVKYQFDGWESCTRFCGEVFFFGTVKEAVRQGFSAGVALTGGRRAGAGKPAGPVDGPQSCGYGHEGKYILLRHRNPCEQRGGAEQGRERGHFRRGGPCIHPAEIGAG